MIEVLIGLNIPFSVVVSTPFGIEKSPLGKDIFLIAHISSFKSTIPDRDERNKVLSKFHKSSIDSGLLEYDFEEEDVEYFTGTQDDYNRVPNTEGGRVYEYKHFGSIKELI